MIYFVHPVTTDREQFSSMTAILANFCPAAGWVYRMIILTYDTIITQLFEHSDLAYFVTILQSKFLTVRVKNPTKVLPLQELENFYV